MENTTAYDVDAIYIAHYGAAKMFAQGYEMRPLGDGSRYEVTNPEDVRYTVAPFATLPTCTCPQCEERAICKHIVFAQGVLNDVAEAVWHLESARADEMAEAYETIRVEMIEAEARYYSGHFA